MKGEPDLLGSGHGWLSACNGGGGLGSGSLCVYSQMRSALSSSLALTMLCSASWHNHLWAILPP